MPRKASIQRGFTLIEVQIGMLLLILITGLLYGALFMANKSWSQGQRIVESIENQRMVLSLLRQQISQAIPLYWNTRRGSALQFKGENDYLQFVGRLPISSGSDALHLIEVSLKEDSQKNNTNSLIYRYQKLHFDNTALEQNDKLSEQIIARDIQSITISYYGNQSNAQKGMEWHDRWDKIKQPPKLVNLKIRDLSGQNWPELIIPIRVNDVKSLNQFQVQAQQNRNARSTKQTSEQAVNER